MAANSGGRCIFSKMIHPRHLSGAQRSVPTEAEWQTFTGHLHRRLRWEHQKPLVLFAFGIGLAASHYLVQPHWGHVVLSGVVWLLALIHYLVDRRNRTWQDWRAIRALPAEKQPSRFLQWLEARPPRRILILGGQPVVGHILYTDRYPGFRTGDIPRYLVGFDPWRYRRGTDWLVQSLVPFHGMAE